MNGGPIGAAAIVTVGMAGLMLGTLLTVVIARVPAGVPVRGVPALPGAPGLSGVPGLPGACPLCAEPIRWRDSVPILSWLDLRGRCRACRGWIGVRYPAIEAVTGLLCALVVMVVGPTSALPAALYLVLVGVALAVIDLDTARLPDRLTLPSYPILAALLVLPAALEGRWTDYGRALVGALALFVGYLLLALFNRRGMGLGDVKLAGVLGMALAWSGWSAWLAGTVLAFVAAAVVGLGLMGAGRAGRRSTIPFGPFMLAGALLGLLVGPDLVTWYLGLATG